MTQKEINREVARKLNEVLKDEYIGEKHVHDDKGRGWGYSIPGESLQEKHPLIMKHYRGPFFVVIPYKDNEKLLNEVISVEQYVNEAYWSYGYLVGDSMLHGASWMPLEEGPGIHAHAKIIQYMNDSSNMVNARVDGQQEKYEMSIKPVDDRIAFATTVKERIERIWGLKAVGFYPQNNNSILCFKGWEEETVNVYLSKHTMADILYHPGKYDVEKLAESLPLEVGNPWHYEGERLCPATRKKVTDETPIEELYDFWSES